MSSIAIITARGGSKRIPKKNIKYFCGKPIIAYSIEAALSSEIFDKVMVSTDDKEIAEIAIKYGAEVPFFRSAETSDDYATTYDVINEVLLEYKNAGNEFDYACCIYPTAPFVTGEKLNKAFEIITEQNFSTVLPIVKFSYPPQRAFIIRENSVQYQYPENISKRSQDLEAIYHDCGQFYFINVHDFNQEKKLIMKNCHGIVMSETEVQDIDSISDWELAELKYKLMNNNK